MRLLQEQMVGSPAGHFKELHFVFLNVIGKDAMEIWVLTQKNSILLLWVLLLGSLQQSAFI